jgi:hypothetical protein
LKTKIETEIVHKGVENISIQDKDVNKGGDDIQSDDAASSTLAMMEDYGESGDEF